MNKRSIRGEAAVVGVGETTYYKHGHSPDREFVLALKAILAAAKDAGVDAKSIDGFVSFSYDRNTALRVANALGVREMRWATMQWGGGAYRHERRAGTRTDCTAGLYSRRSDGRRSSRWRLSSRNLRRDQLSHPTAEFSPLAPRLFAMAGVTPKDVDVVQSYENFTGGVVMSLVEHGFCY